MSSARTRSDPARPRIVLITGEPGSGKTTLGAALSQAIRVPFLARDQVRGGLLATSGAWTDHLGEVPTPDLAVETFIQMLEHAAGLGVSCVAEYVVRQQRPQDLERLTAAADVVVLVAACARASHRFAQRERADRLLNRAPVLDALGYETIDDHLAAVTPKMAAVTAAMQTKFDLPTLIVDTGSGYQPDLDHIIDFVTATHA